MYPKTKKNHTMDKQQKEIVLNFFIAVLI